MKVQANAFYVKTKVAEKFNCWKTTAFLGLKLLNVVVVILKRNLISSDEPPTKILNLFPSETNFTDTCVICL